MFNVLSATNFFTRLTDLLQQIDAHLEVSKPFVLSLEQGKKAPNAATILKIADFFAVSLEQLMRDELEVD